MKLRLWPRSLIGQLVFAVAVMLFVAQAVNFTLLARGQKQQTLAHGGGMAVARIIDAVDRDRRGDFRPRPGERHDDPRERERAQKLVISDRPVPVPTGAVRCPTSPTMSPTCSKTPIFRPRRSMPGPCRRDRGRSGPIFRAGR